MGRIALVYLEKLPEEILIKILRYLPAVDAIRVGAVSKKWEERKNASTLRAASDNDIPIQKPWYYMFTQLGDSKRGCVYNSDLQIWHEHNFPSLKSCYFSGVLHEFYDECSFSSSNGLVCVMEYDHPGNIYICNPILNRGLILPEIPNTPMITFNCAVFISVDINSKLYSVFLVRYSKEDQMSRGWDITINLYESNTNCWTKVYQGKKNTMQPGEQCVVCKDVLYQGVHLDTRPQYVVDSYELAKPTTINSSIETRINVPCDFRSIYLMNLRDKLVMVGHIHENLVKIGIWEWDNKEWNEIASMPQEFMDVLEHLGIILSYGYGDFIFVQSFKSRTLIMFDFRQKVWKQVATAPVYIEPDSESLEYLDGFCFEPRLDIYP